MDQANLGPAERILQTVLNYTDHLVHGRPGIVTPDARHNVGVRWEYATYRLEGTDKVAFRIVKQGKKNVEVRVGVIRDGKIWDGTRQAGEYREAGIFPEVAVWMYRQVAEIWKLDNEFAARWASYQFGQQHKDLKVILAAFLLVQSRKGDPVMDGGKMAFRDDDFRDVAEAMMLIRKDDDLTPKLLLRIRKILEIPGIVDINRQLGFCQSAKNPTVGRWNKVVHKWLRHREGNPKLLDGLIKAGYKTTVLNLCRKSGYKPEGPAFFAKLRWKQQQAADGRRQMAIGQEVTKAESWTGLTEEEICQKIVAEKPNYKRIVGLVPPSVGLTKAVVAAAIEAGSLSGRDLIIATPTLEDLGLLQVQDIKTRWEAAVKQADDMRVANIAKRVKNEDTKAQLVAATDDVLKKATEQVMKGIRVYVFIDRSGSMQAAIVAATKLITKMLPAFPLEKMHVAHFNTQGQEVTFKASTAVAVEHAFKGVGGTGGTDHGSGVRALQHRKPESDEDVLFIFVGDQQQMGTFENHVKASGINPMAFGFVDVPGTDGNRYKAVEHTAVQLGIPCFRIDEKTFEDTYAIPRTIRALIAATPVGVAVRPAVQARFTLAETILKTPLLAKPIWAAGFA